MRWGLAKNTQISSFTWHCLYKIIFILSAWKATCPETWTTKFIGPQNLVMYIAGLNNALKINTLWLSHDIWRHRSGSTLAEVMACYLTALSHYINQAWLITNSQCLKLSQKVVGLPVLNLKSEIWNWRKINKNFPVLLQSCRPRTGGPVGIFNIANSVLCHSPESNFTRSAHWPWIYSLTCVLRLRT